MYICSKIQPGLERSPGGGWTIPSSRIPFSSDYELEREKDRLAQETGDTHEHAGEHSSASKAAEPTELSELKNEEEIPIADDALDTSRLDISFGWPDTAAPPPTPPSPDEPELYGRREIKEKCLQGVCGSWGVLLVAEQYMYRARSARS